MNNINNFFRVLYTHPHLLWRVVAGFLFLFIALFIFLIPRLTASIDSYTRNIFAVFLLIYALFRLGTFYMDYKRITRDE